MARAIAGLQVHRPARDFKAPVYRGEGDVELFLTQFTAVQHANAWTDAQAVLHIRAKLEGRAVGCGKGTTIVQIFNDLRARFGLNRRQAKDRLTSMRRSAKQSLHEHAEEVGRLVELAFPTLGRPEQVEMEIDYFIGSLDNRALQRHMLAVAPADMTQAVRGAEEFSQVGGTDRPTRAAVTAVETGPMEKRMDKMESLLSSMAQTLSSQTTLMAHLTARPTERLQYGREGNQRTPPPQQGNRGGHQGPPRDQQNFDPYRGGSAPTLRNEQIRPRRPMICYQCGGPHLKRQCPHLPDGGGAPERQGPTQGIPVTTQQSGNGQSPSQ